MDTIQQMDLLREFARKHHVFYAYVEYLEAAANQKVGFDYGQCLTRLRDAMMSDAKSRVEHYICQIGGTLESGRY